MDSKLRHIVIEAFRSVFRDKVESIWLSAEQSRKYGADCFLARCDLSLSDFDNILSPAVLIETEIARKTGRIVDVAYGDNEICPPCSAKDEVIYGEQSLCPAPAIFIPVLDISPKGYYAINTQASSLLAQHLGIYEKCFDKTRRVLNSKKDTLYGTSRMLMYMHDNLPPETMLKWFSYDTPLIQQLRHSSPFASAVPMISAEDYRRLLRYVVDNPDKFPPRPTYDQWLCEVLEAGHINDFTAKYFSTKLREELGLPLDFAPMEVVL